MAVVDISGALLAVDMYEEFIIVLWVRLSELMAKTDPITYRNLKNRERTDGDVCQAIPGLLGH